MSTYVVLLRGINVGTARPLPMERLRALCLTLDLMRPETYIRSGNLIVDCTGDAAALRKLLERELAARFGFEVDVVVRKAVEWKRYLAANPFADDAAALAKHVHLYVSRDPLKPGAAPVLQAAARGDERVAVAGRALWIDYGAQGVHSSKLTPALIDRACGSPTTGRNWNSVIKIQSMLDARS